MSPSLPTTREKISRAQFNQKFSGARAFYLIVLVISILTAFSWITNRTHPVFAVGSNGQLYPRAEVGLVDGTAHAKRGELARRDEAVRTFLESLLLLLSRSLFHILVPSRAWG